MEKIKLTQSVLFKSKLLQDAVFPKNEFSSLTNDYLKYVEIVALKIGIWL